MKSILAAIFLLGIIGAGVWYFSDSKTNAIANPGVQNVELNPPSRPYPDGTTEFHSLQRHFVLHYPSNMKFMQYYEDDGPYTVVFQNRDDTSGFQVYVASTSEPTITKARFLQDDPSGVMNNPTNIVVDGAPATMFYGNNADIGDTREVWFIKNGLLYEVTAPKNFDEELSKIMATWKFI